MLEIPCVPFFKQNGHLWLFGPKFASRWILGSKFLKPMSGLEISILEILCVPIFRENRELWILGPNCPKMDFGVEISKILIWIRNQHPWDTMCTNFQTKRTTFNFWAQICPKVDFRVEISKIWVWIRNQHLQYTMCANFPSKWTTFNF